MVNYFDEENDMRTGIKSTYKYQYQSLITIQTICQKPTKVFIYVVEAHFTFINDITQMDTIWDSYFEDSQKSLA